MVLKPSEVSNHMADTLSTLVPQYLDKVSPPPPSTRDDCVGGGGGVGNQVFKSRETVDYYSKWEESSS